MDKRSTKEQTRVVSSVANQGTALIIVRPDEGPTLETSVFGSFTVANLPYRPCG